MSSFSVWTANGTLNHLFRGTAFNVPGRFLALFTSPSGLENNTIGTANEVAVGPTGYARPNIDANGGFAVAVNSSMSNVQEFDFPIATSDWGTITHTAIMDAATGGNVVAWGPLLNPRIIYTGDSIKVPAGAFTITLT